MDQDGTCHGGGSHSRPHCAAWGRSSPSKKGAHPQFSAHIYCSQWAGWIKMPLGTEVGLGRGDIVLDGHPAPLLPKRHSPQYSTRVCCGQTTLCIRIPLGTELGLVLGHTVLWGPSCPSKQGGTAPNFRPMSIVAKRLDESGCQLVWRYTSAQATLC